MHDSGPLNAGPTTTTMWMASDGPTVSYYCSADRSIAHFSLMMARSDAQNVRSTFDSVRPDRTRAVMLSSTLSAMMSAIVCRSIYNDPSTSPTLMTSRSGCLDRCSSDCCYHVTLESRLLLGLSDKITISFLRIFFGNESLEVL